MSARNLHRIAGAADTRRRDACAGLLACIHCPRSSVGYIESFGGRGGLVKPVCADHAAQGERLGYTVHREATA